MMFPDRLLRTLHGSLQKVSVPLAISRPAARARRSPGAASGSSPPLARPLDRAEPLGEQRHGDRALVRQVDPRGLAEAIMRCALLLAE
jgi:hypothetical protein